MRREERSAEAAASRCSPVSSSSSSSRFASTEVSGVRSSCEASATNSRWRASAPSVSARALVERREHRVQRAGQLGHLVLGLGVGQLQRGVARALDLARAAAVSSAIGSIARRAVARPASSASSAPPSTPKARNTFTRLAVSWMSETSARVLDEPRPASPMTGTRRVSTRQPSISPCAAYGGRSRARSGVL